MWLLIHAGIIVNPCMLAEWAQSVYCDYWRQLWPWYNKDQMYNPPMVMPIPLSYLSEPMWYAGNWEILPSIKHRDEHAMRWWSHCLRLMLHGRRKNRDNWVWNRNINVFISESWHLISLTIQLFLNSLFSLTTKETLMLCITGTLWGESTGDQWISITKC